MRGAPVSAPLDSEFVASGILGSIETKQALLDQAEIIAGMADAVARSLRAGGSLLAFGNGGSAADAQHIAAELSGRFEIERPALAAEALTVNSSALTAIGNDYGYDQIFRRQLEGRARKGDVALGISTSGNSRNVILALELAREKGCITLGMTGEGGGEMAREGRCDHLLAVPSRNTARIQECHILAGHILCAWLERALHGDR
jgi:D-sedoheptulose 7-phosphate isomerase